MFHFRRDQQTTEVVVGQADGFLVTFTVDGKRRTVYLLGGGGDPEYVSGADLTEFNKIWPLAVGKKVTR